MTTNRPLKAVSHTFRMTGAGRLSGRLLILSLIYCLSISSALPAASVRKVAAADIDALFAPWNRSDSPGCAVAVVQGGRIVYERGYGMADLEHGIPITPDTAFYVGSIAKQFTGFAVALLADRKLISLDDDVHRYLPELPDYGSRVTIGQLLHHTSGLRDFLTLRELTGESNDAIFGDAEALRTIVSQRELNFPPGSQHLYSNTGYFLLSQIVKRVTGTSLREFAAINIFQPLGMDHTQFRDDHTRLISNRADAYRAVTHPDGAEVQDAADRFRRDAPNFDVVGGGGLFMSVHDFLGWDRNFYDARVGGPQVIAQVLGKGRLNDGKVVDYALGQNVIHYRGLDTVEHGGANGSYRAYLLRFPAQQLSVAVFANLGTVRSDLLAKAVATLYLQDLMPEPAPVEPAGPPAPWAAQGIPPSSKALQALAGAYISPELDVTYRLHAHNNALVLTVGDEPPKPLVAISPDTFAFDYTRLKFTRSGGKVSGFVIDAGLVTALKFQRK